MAETAQTPQPQPAPPPEAGATVLDLDGKGGILPEGALSAPDPATPPKAFRMVAGSVRSEAFTAWLRDQLPPLEFDTLTSPSSGPRCHALEDRAIVAMRVVSSGGDDVSRSLVTMVLQRGLVIVVSDLHVAEMLGLSRSDKSRFAPVSPADLVARLGLRALERLEPHIEKLGDRLDDLEQGIASKIEGGESGQLARFRRNLIRFRRLIWPLRDVIDTLEIEDLSFFSRRDRVRLREAGFRAARLGEELQVLSERAGLIHEQLLDARSDQMNRTILVLTAFTTLFMPLTLITGILGMNVPIPFQNHPLAFAGVMVFLVVLAIIQIAWFRLRRWF